MAISEKKCEGCRAPIPNGGVATDFCGNEYCKDCSPTYADLDRMFNEAEEKLATALAENERLREQLRWRKWPDEKPEDQQDCIVAFEPAGEFGAANFRDREWLVGWDAEGKDPTFWMPLPTPPEAK